MTTINPKTFIARLSACRDYFAKIYSVSDLIDQVLFADLAISQKRLPSKLGKLELTDKMLQQIKDLIAEQITSGMSQKEIDAKVHPAQELDWLLTNFRQYLIERYGMYAYISKDWAADLLKYLDGRPALELMAGKGYLTYAVRNLDENYPITATDNYDWSSRQEELKPVTKVVRMDALAAIDYYSKKGQAIIMSWPPQNSISDWLIVNYLRQQHFYEKGGELILIGEKNGVTGSSQFWKKAETKEIYFLNHNWSNFDIVKDQVFTVS